MAASRYPLARGRLADSLATHVRWEIADEPEGVGFEEVDGATALRVDYEVSAN